MKEIEQLYKMVDGGKPISAQWLNDKINKSKTNFLNELIEKIKPYEPEFNALDAEEFLAEVYTMCDLYSIDAFAKGILFARTLDNELNEFSLSEDIDF